MAKYLINKTNGQIIEVTKVMRSEDKVVYQLYDNGIDLRNGKILKSEIVPFNVNLTPETPLSFTQMLDFIGVSTILSLYPEFEESEDTVNWVHLKGSTGLDTMFRILIPSDLIGKQMYTGSPLDLLIQAMSPLSQWNTRGDNSLVQYLEELLDEHKTLLEAYAEQGVIIDSKIIEEVTEPIV